MKKKLGKLTFGVGSNLRLDLNHREQIWLSDYYQFLAFLKNFVVHAKHYLKYFNFFEVLGIQELCLTFSNVVLRFHHLPRQSYKIKFCQKINNFNLKLSNPKYDYNTVCSGIFLTEQTHRQRIKLIHRILNSISYMRLPPDQHLRELK